MLNSSRFVSTFKGLFWEENIFKSSWKLGLKSQVFLYNIKYLQPSMKVKVPKTNHIIYEEFNTQNVSLCGCFFIRFYWQKPTNISKLPSTGKYNQEHKEWTMCSMYRVEKWHSPQGRPWTVICYWPLSRITWTWKRLNWEKRQRRWWPCGEQLWQGPFTNLFVFFSVFSWSTRPG